MEFPQQHYYKLNEIYLRIIGMWPYQSFYSSILRKLFLLFVLIASSVYEGWRIIVNKDNFTLFVDIMPEFILIASCSICCVILYHKMKDSCHLYDLLCNDWKALYAKQEIIIKEAFARKTKILTILASIYTFIMYMPVIFISKFLSIFATNNETEQELSDTKNSAGIQLKCILLILHLILTFILAPIFILANATLFSVYIYHICGMFAAVGYRLESVLFNNSQNKEILVNRNKARSTIIFCLKKHREAIDFSCVLGDCYKPCCILVIISIVIQVSLTLAQLSDLQTINLKSATFIFGQLFFFAAVSYLSQKIIDSNQELAITMYSIPWYAYPVEIQKLLLLILQKCNNSKIFNTAKTFTMSLENFAVVLKAAVSYCMFIKSLK